ncbi:MAG: GGDEF domain-containing protein [Steroidobacteraceae bacterium]
MRYRESSSQSAELLRLALPQIAHNGGCYYPTTYAVWYEYLSGGNLPLAKDINHRLEINHALTQVDVDKLYDLHIDTHKVHQVEQLQVNLSDLLLKLSNLASSSGDDAAEYARTLAECEATLKTISDPVDLSKLVAGLLSSTHVMRTSAETMLTELESTREEMSGLRVKLGHLQNEAVTDPLTGLRNRRGFTVALEQLFSDGPDAFINCAIMIADIDHFKKVNDSYGHLFGDQVLRTAAQALKSVVKGRDVVARFGGEEFIILLPNTPEQGAFALAEQLRNTFAKGRIRRSNSNEYIDTVTISIGVAKPLPGESLEQVIDRADKALYRAKQEGRNCVRIAA